jgi:hypothetical protein
MNGRASADLDRLILDSAREANVLPITSRCDSHCLFCSHHNNPPGIATFSLGVRSLQEITRTLAFLDPGHVITIGESATRIIEGEPFSHPEFQEILSLTRRVYPETPIEITTNGRRLTAETIAFLEGLGGISLSVSLNSVSARGRQLLMGDSAEQSLETVAGMDLLGDSAIRFSGSLVAMPNLTGWDDIRDTVLFLAGHGAVAVRVVLPAFSAQAGRNLLPDPDRIYEKIRKFVRELAPEAPCPVLVEPSCVTDLTPVVSGVVKDSPAWRAGIRAGDVFVTVNGNIPRCRVDAWNLLLPPGNVSAEIRRDGRIVNVPWTNNAEGDAGVTMEYDFDPARADSLARAIRACKGRSLLLTSELGHAVVCRVLESIEAAEPAAPERATATPAVEAVSVQNLTFGGTIRAAGLLTVDDYWAAYSSWLEPAADSAASHPAAAPAQLIVPLESFDVHGLDLKGVHFLRLQKLAGAPVIVL